MKNLNILGIKLKFLKNLKDQNKNLWILLLMHSATHDNTTIKVAVVVVRSISWFLTRCR